MPISGKQHKGSIEIEATEDHTLVSAPTMCDECGVALNIGDNCYQVRSGSLRCTQMGCSTSNIIVAEGRWDGRQFVRNG